MRILHIVHQFAPHFVGGTELNTAGLAEQQVQHGHDVAIFVPAPIESKNDNPVDVADEKHGRVYRVPVGQRSATQVFRDTLANSGPIADALDHVLADFRPEVIHIQHLMGLPVRAVSKLLKSYDAPIIITLLDFWWVCANAQLLTNDTEEICDGPNRFINCGRCAAARANQPLILAPALAPIFALRSNWLRPLLTQADATFAPTQFVADWYSQRVDFKHPVKVIPLGFEPPTHLPEPTQSLAADGPLKLAYVGGLSQQKGVHVIIQAINQLKEIDLTLTIGGDEDKFPEYVAHLKQASDNRVTFRGKLPPAVVRQLMAESDLLLVPSIWYETYAIVVSEAFAAGIPVAVSDLGALAERVEDRVTGFKVPPANAEAWARTIEHAAKNRPILSRMAMNKPKSFTMKDHYLAINTLYKEAQQRYQRG
ncbi:MAG: glycosyltransferase [Chloroflexota bacterium]